MENIIFGIRPVAEAIQSGRQIERLYIKKDAGGQLMTEFKDLCWRYRVRWQEVPVEKLNRMTRGNHQGVVAQIAAIGYVALQDILDRVPDDETPLIVVFDGVTDVRNFGAIARSAECAGAHGLIVPMKNAAPVNAEAVKASAGAMFRVPICKSANLTDTAYYLKQYGQHPQYAEISLRNGHADSCRDREVAYADLRCRPRQADGHRHGKRGQGDFKGGS